jgi:dipeptidyl-peptidase-4
MTLLPRSVRAALFLLLVLVLAAPAEAQRRGRAPSGPGTVQEVSWSEDGRSLYFSSEGARFQLDLGRFEVEEIGADEGQGVASHARGGGRPGASLGAQQGRPIRGRQHTEVDSPDGQWQARFRDWNVVLVEKESGKEIAVTEDGDADIHYGTASWVYGEELDQITAMWWSPDSSKLLFYRFDDTGVLPFHLVTGWTEINTTHYPEYYPKAGATNPGAELMVYDLKTKRTRKVGAGGGREEYLYGVLASPDGDTVMVHWTDRLQQHMKLLAIDLKSGKTRTVVEERQDTWQNNHPSIRWLADGQRFLWETDRSGYTHYELRDLSGKLHHPVTAGEFQTEGIEFLDEEAGLVGFTAYSSATNPYYLQYHLVGLDGEGQRRVTTEELHHSNFQLSPDGAWLVAQYESVDVPPCTAVYRTEDGEKVAVIAESDPASAAGLAELFSFRSDDGQFDIHGVLYKPADFDPAKSYPLIDPLYAGPDTLEWSAGYVGSPQRYTDQGYLVVKVNSRGTGKRGKAFLGATYLRLGDVDIQDHADAVRLLRERPYVDGDRVGIIGVSYGGYMAAMGVLKHADVFTAGVAAAAVTDWRNYDTIYTERYMSTPQLNPDGYRTGAAMTWVDQLQGHLLITHGMVDDNVHPNNAFQLIEALDQAGKPYESRFWPNVGHGLGRGGSETINDFFRRWLKP